MDQTIFEKVRSILVEQMGGEEDEITPETDLTTDLGCDPLDVVEIGLVIEEKFDVEIPDGAIPDQPKVKDYVDWLAAHVGG